MQIAVGILEKFNSLKEGKVYYGEFARDTSLHAAVVITMHNDRLNCYCISSSKSFIDSVSKYDEKAVVRVSDLLVDRIFSEQHKESWIYCGKANLKKISRKDFLDMLSKGSISFREEVSDNFLAELKDAVRNSVTYSKKDLEELGL
ncbi:MAG: hypothetical protein HDR35_10175 [Treponema sp.]|nr:hypothetical protein [Treponema sp.]